MMTTRIQTPIYNLYTPDKLTYPIVASIPHSGTYVPDDIKRTFKRNPAPILTNMDWHLDKLYRFLPDSGVAVLEATHSRYVIDLNRPPTPPLFGPYETSVVPSETTFGRALYETAPSPQEIEARVDQYYRPYHQKLSDLLQEMLNAFGKVYLFDLHSFFIQTTADICLGNQNNRTSSGYFLSIVEKSFNRYGFSVSKNKMLKGGYITNYYGRLDRVESLQIEIRFPTYLDKAYFGEEKIKTWDSPKFRSVQRRLQNVFREIIKAQFPVLEKSDDEDLGKGKREGYNLRPTREIEGPKN